MDSRQAILPDAFRVNANINRVTLFALILALGLLVDDPITGIDNIECFMRN